MISFDPYDFHGLFHSWYDKQDTSDAPISARELVNEVIDYGFISSQQDGGTELVEEIERIYKILVDYDIPKYVRDIKRMDEIFKTLETLETIGVFTIEKTHNPLYLALGIYCRFAFPCD